MISWPHYCLLGLGTLARGAVKGAYQAVANQCQCLRIRNTHMRGSPTRAVQRDKTQADLDAQLIKICPFEIPWKPHAALTTVRA